MEDLASRGLKGPLLAILDGSPALRAGVQAPWPEALVQRCTVHKLRNLLAHALRNAHEAVKEGFHRFLQIRSPTEAPSN